MLAQMKMMMVREERTMRDGEGDSDACVHHEFLDDCVDVQRRGEDIRTSC